MKIYFGQDDAINEGGGFTLKYVPNEPHSNLLVKLNQNKWSFFINFDPFSRLKDQENTYIYLTY